LVRFPPIRLGFLALLLAVSVSCSNSSVQSPGGGGPSIPSAGGAGLPGGLPGGGLPGAGLPGSGQPGGAPTGGKSGQSGAASKPGGEASDGEAAKGAAGGAPGAEGQDSRAGGAGAGGLPDTGAGGGGAGDPEAVFDKSLGDFDDEIGRERDAMASAGKGAGRSAEQRETGDAGAVKSAGSGAGLPGEAGRGERAESGGMSGAGGRSGKPGETSDGKSGESASTSEEAGEGEAGARSDRKDGEKAPGESEKVEGVEIPADIPADGSGEDQVARQIREAAMAEQDPQVRDALWEQYRRHTGIGK
jgi:hypothetical protein